MGLSHFLVKPFKHAALAAPPFPPSHLNPSLKHAYSSGFEGHGLNDEGLGDTRHFNAILLCSDGHWTLYALQTLWPDLCSILLSRQKSAETALGGREALVLFLLFCMHDITECILGSSLVWTAASDHNPNAGYRVSVKPHDLFSSIFSAKYRQPMHTGRIRAGSVWAWGLVLMT